MAVVAVVSAALVVVGAVLQGGGGTSQAASPPATRRPPVLDLGVLVAAGADGPALAAAEQAWNAGKRSLARRGFERLVRRDPAPLEAAVGAAVTAWPGGALPRLERLAATHPASGLVRLNLGLALYANRDPAGARRQWRTAEARDPDSSAAVHAESLLHPEMAPGLPQFTPPVPLPREVAGLPPGRLLEALRRRAEHDGPDAWLLAGAYLQQVERPVSARAAFDRAVALAPHDLAALTAAAVGRFDKDNLGAAFSHLGPLTRRFPRSQIVRFYLGLLLAWTNQRGESLLQFKEAYELGPTTELGRGAKAFVDRVGAGGTSGSKK